ncbi:MAG TPA: WbuC family cupin fold metalloprotein [Candidatus Baltobacteraceae bacterium]|nr:WbuC family cupin fold metalloprotein [Candidatus Baltobacteraceae bacterium]
MRLRVDGPDLREAGPDVWYASGPLGTFGAAEIAFLKECAKASPRMRARICAHENVDSPVHEMLIAHHRSCYVRPHRHPYKAESLLVVEGEATAVFFDDAGGVQSTLELGAAPAATFSYRTAPGIWHGLLIRSDWLLFVEHSSGPFDPQSSEFPQWAPDGSNAAESAAYIEGVMTRVSRQNGA